MITTTIMSSHMFITSTCLCSSSTVTKPVTHSLTSTQQHKKVPNFGVHKNKSHLGLTVFSQWSGLKHLGVSVTPRLLCKEKKRKCRGVKVSASLFGVGAPEALVIGVVALLVFGPKGLAEVARNLGKTLRAFQPTIKELQDVSREFKSTLEKEIGLDDIPSSTQRMYTSERFNGAQSPSSTVSAENSQTPVDPNGVTSPNSAYSTEEYLKFTEEQLKSSATKQEQQPNVQEIKSEPQNQPQVSVKDNADAAVPPLEKPESKT